MFFFRFPDFLDDPDLECKELEGGDFFLTLKDVSFFIFKIDYGVTWQIEINTLVHMNCIMYLIIVFNYLFNKEII